MSLVLNVCIAAGLPALYDVSDEEVLNLRETLPPDTSSMTPSLGIRTSGDPPAACLEVTAWSWPDHARRHCHARILEAVKETSRRLARQYHETHDQVTADRFARACAVHERIREYLAPP